MQAIQFQSFVLQHLQQLERCRKIRAGCSKIVTTGKDLRLLRQAPCRILLSHQSVSVGCLKQQFEVFSRRQRGPGCFSNEIFNTCKTQLTCIVLWCFRCFSVGHNAVLKTMRQPATMAAVGSHTVQARPSTTVWCHCSSLWFRCWRKTAEVTYHLRHLVREELKVLSVALFYSGL